MEVTAGSSDSEPFGDDFVEGNSIGSEEENGIDDPDVLEGEQEEEVLDDDDDSDPFDSADEVHGDMGMWSEDDDATSELDAANIEGLSKHLDAKAAEDAATAQAELEEAAIQTNIAGDSIPGLDEDEDREYAKPRLAPDLQLLRQRMTETIRILDDFSKHKKTTNDPRSRSDYTAQLRKDVCAYFNYSPFLAEKLLSLFSAREAFAFFESNETPRPLVIRTNTLKTHRRSLAQALINRGVTLEPVGKWSKVGLQVFESSVPLGATPEYLAGHYILQAASSFLPVMALAPQENERVLDMASAPGGKITHAAALMKNTGTIFANDSNKTRAKALIGNISRLGVKNAIVSNCDALSFTKTMWAGFDRVLLDAPCSGTGVIAKDASVKTGKTEQDFIRLPELQKKLLLAAIDCTDHSSKTGGYLVYSTCSVTVEENEQVVSYALRRRPNVKIAETGLPFGREGFTRYGGKVFPEQMKMTRRYYPHAYNVDGFFVCKLRKMGPTVKGATGATGPVENGMSAVSKEGDATTDRELVEGSGAGSLPQTKDGVVRSAGEDDDDDDFGGFSEDEDREIIGRKRRNALRKKGLDPRADRRKAKTRQSHLTNS